MHHRARQFDARLFVHRDELHCEAEVLTQVKNLGLQRDPAFDGQLDFDVDATSDGQRAAAVELALEALYLAKRIDKVSGEGETVYG